MLITIFLALLATGLIIAILALIGRKSLSNAFAENDRQGALVNDFHRSLVVYAKSNGEDQSAYRELLMKSSAVERSLGWDNFVTGVRVGLYMMNGAQLLPLALHEMRREYGDGFGLRDTGGEIADIIQTVLFRHLGRRIEQADEIKAEGENLGSCIAAGWATLAAIPIWVLSAFGILSAARADAARSSLPFKLWNLLLAVAAISGPLIAYLADREKIDAAMRALLP